MEVLNKKEIQKAEQVPTSETLPQSLESNYNWQTLKAFGLATETAGLFMPSDKKVENTLESSIANLLNVQGILSYGDKVNFQPLEQIQKQLAGINLEQQPEAVLAILQQYFGDRVKLLQKSQDQDKLQEYIETSSFYPTTLSPSSNGWQICFKSNKKFEKHSNNDHNLAHIFLSQVHHQIANYRLAPQETPTHESIYNKAKDESSRFIPEFAFVIDQELPRRKVEESWDDETLASVLEFYTLNSSLDEKTAKKHLETIRQVEGQIRQSQRTKIKFLEAEKEQNKLRIRDNMPVEPEYVNYKVNELSFEKLTEYLQ